VEHVIETTSCCRNNKGSLCVN